jgi:hypothetical protein
MTRIFLFSVIFGFLLGYTVRGHAAEIPSGASFTRNHPVKNYSLSAAFNYGPSSLSERDAPDLNTRGNFRQVLAMLNRKVLRWNFGAGLGFFASDLTGTNTAAPSGSSLGLSRYSREIAGEVARIAGSYRLTDHLAVGLSLDLLFGSDVGFSSNVFESEMSAAWLAGTELLYGFELGGVQWKAGPRYFASLNLPDRRLDAVQGVLEAEMPVF